jgi:ABC-type transport system involved in multi-copper enzyme maturation permease subunit
LLLLILSTLAKSTGTAIMFGVMLWLLYNFFWGVVLLLVTWAAGLSPADRGYYDLTILSGLLNLNDLYVALLAISYPGNASNPFTFQGEELLPTWAPGAAYAVWLAVLFLVALWVFNRRAAE